MVGPDDSLEGCDGWPTPVVAQHRKVVVALYDYDATEVGDMSLRKHDELEVLDDAQEHWWKMRNIETGLEGFAPSNYVREQGSNCLQQYDWYLGNARRPRAEDLLMKEEREGGFFVRNSSTNSGIYTLSVFSKQSRPQVKHYHIKKDQEGHYFLSHHIKCPTIPELIYRHQLNPAGLCTRLRPSLQGREAPTTAGLGHVIFAESLEVLVMALEALHEEAKPLGLEVSWLKTKVQVFGDLLDEAVQSVHACGEDI
ncbi:Tyrosine-protein kinase Btk29A [Chionoecetes opilio]|uniref:Tyrosine-protein kinase Btk29A n=1 Tax=Chionoecetes opilio TaxID=41210 RepID=A0A8J5CJK6_CHIOP|nr:Tyrosine-protein kinase Btk29A [Chionoecetes opilio]